MDQKMSSSCSWRNLKTDIHSTLWINEWFENDLRDYEEPINSKGSWSQHCYWILSEVCAPLQLERKYVFMENGHIFFKSLSWMTIYDRRFWLFFWFPEAAWRYSLTWKVHKLLDPFNSQYVKRKMGKWGKIWNLDCPGW